MRDCAGTTGLLSPFLDGDLSAPEMERVRRHLAGCPGCRAELELLRAAVTALRETPPLPAPAGILQGVRAGLEGPGRTRRIPRPWRLFGLPAGALATLLVVFGVYLFQARFPGLHRQEITAPAPPAAGTYPPAAVATVPLEAITPPEEKEERSAAAVEIDRGPAPAEEPAGRTARLARRDRSTERVLPPLPAGEAAGPAPTPAAPATAAAEVKAKAAALPEAPAPPAHISHEAARSRRVAGEGSPPLAARGAVDLPAFAPPPPPEAVGEVAAFHDTFRPAADTRRDQAGLEAASKERVADELADDGDAFREPAPASLREVLVVLSLTPTPVEVLRGLLADHNGRVVDLLLLDEPARERVSTEVKDRLPPMGPAARAWRIRVRIPPGEIEGFLADIGDHDGFQLLRRSQEPVPRSPASPLLEAEINVIDADAGSAR